MATSTEKEKSTPTIKRKPVLILGGVILAFSLYLLVFLVPDVLRTATGAESMTMERAGEIANDESAYVTITDARWDCDTIAYVRGRSSTNSLKTITRFTEIFATDDSDEIIMLAQMSGEMTCGDFDGLVPTGYLTRMTSGRQQELTNDARLARFISAETYLDLCGYCGQENSMIGVIMGSLFALLGIGILVYGWRMSN